MITIEKLKEYEEYGGVYDGFYIQKVKKRKNLTSSEEWKLITQLIQDVFLVESNLASKKFAEDLERKLETNCNDEITIAYFKILAKKI